jgi:hypothetical protein
VATQARKKRTTPPFRQTKAISPKSLRKWR